MPKKGTKRSGFRKLRKTMKGGGKRWPKYPGVYSKLPSVDLPRRATLPPTEEFAFGLLVVAFIIYYFMDLTGMNSGGGKDSNHSPTNMLKQLPHNFLNSEGQLNVSKVLSDANVPKNIIDKVTKIYSNIDTGNETVKIILERALKNHILVADAKVEAKKFMGKSISRSPGQ